MNTYTNAVQPKKEGYRTARNPLFHYTTIVAVILTLVTVAAIAISTSNRAAIAAENNMAIPYSNALEMQYARPWSDAQNKSVVAYSNILELQYAQPWLDKANLVVTVKTQEQIPRNCSSSMEMLYACKSGYGLP
jgi:hypothetical protein